MDFYEQLAKSVRETLTIRISDEELYRLAQELSKEACCKALSDIRAVLDDDSLDDPVCFWRIEEIVRIYENLGADGGSRHDFG